MHTKQNIYETVCDLIEFCKTPSFQDRTKSADQAIIDDLVNVRNYLADL